MTQIHTVLVVVHLGRPEAVAAFRTALVELAGRGCRILVDDAGAARAAEELRVDGQAVQVALWEPSHGDEQPDAVVVLGGDGTILRAAELVRGRPVPVLGVNLGHVGFLAEAEPRDLAESVARLVAGDFDVERRGTLELRVTDAAGAGAGSGWALNEASLEKLRPGGMIEVGLAVDARPIGAYGCDGVVVATATGSTAYAFSGGGPVVWPDVDALLVVPLVAHALFARTMVVGPSSTITIDVSPDERSRAVLTMDGRRSLYVEPGSRIDVRRSAEQVLLARLSAAPFSDRLVHKFRLPVAGWRGPEPVEQDS